MLFVIIVPRQVECRISDLGVPWRIDGIPIPPKISTFSRLIIPTCFETTYTLVNKSCTVNLSQTRPWTSKYPTCGLN